jgi:hypothetical protein
MPHMASSAVLCGSTTTSRWAPDAASASATTRAPTASPVLPGITEIRRDRGDSPGPAPPAGVEQEEQFYQVVADRGPGGLDHVDVVAAQVLHGRAQLVGDVEKLVGIQAAERSVLSLYLQVPVDPPALRGLPARMDELLRLAGRQRGRSRRPACPG